MSTPSRTDQELQQGAATPLLDVLVRAGLIIVLAMLCYRVFSPFITLMVWALILAVTIYPLHQYLAGKVGGKQGLAATLPVIFGIVLIVTPTAMLISSLGVRLKRPIISLSKGEVLLKKQWIIEESMTCHRDSMVSPLTHTPDGRNSHGKENERFRPLRTNRNAVSVKHAALIPSPVRERFQHIV